MPAEILVPEYEPPQFATGRRPLRETARIQLRTSRRRWRQRLVVLALLLAGAGALVNFFVIPLEVLIVWGRPAALSITSQPGGANLVLDGRALAETTPVTVLVERDRSDHVVEATMRGYLPGRQVIHYDQSLRLSTFLRLERDPNPPAVPPTTAPAAASGPPGPSKTAAP